MNHSIEITAEPINTEGRPVYGYRAECSCGFVAVAELHAQLVGMAETHIASSIIEGAMYGTR